MGWAAVAKDFQRFLGVYAIPALRLAGSAACRWGHTFSVATSPGLRPGRHMQQLGGPTAWMGLARQTVQPPFRALHGKDHASPHAETLPARRIMVLIRTARADLRAHRRTIARQQAQAPPARRFSPGPGNQILNPQVPSGAQPVATKVRDTAA